MKIINHFFLFALLLSIYSCSNFNEDELIADLDRPMMEVETLLPVINIVVDQNDFDEMYEKP